MRVDHYALSGGSELVAEIPITFTKTGDPDSERYTFFTLYSLAIPSLRQGDVILVHSQFEATTPDGFVKNIMFQHFLMIHEEETIIMGDIHYPNGEYLMPAAIASENITPDIHHGLRTLVGSACIDRDGDAWITATISAASAAAKKGPNNKDMLKIESALKAYGGLSAVVYRNTV